MWLKIMKWLIILTFSDGQMKLHEALSLVNKRLNLLTIQRVYTLWPPGGIVSKLSLL